MKPKRKSLGFLFLPLSALVLSVATFAGSSTPAREVTADPESSEHSHEGYTAWTFTDRLPDSDGSYYLTEDVTILNTVSVNGTLNLCLNGHSITKTGTTGSVFRLYGSNNTLNLYECNTTTHYYYIETQNNLGVVVNSLEEAQAGNPDRNGTFVGGYITGGRGYYSDGHYRGGCIIVDSGAKFNFYGGTMIGNAPCLTDNGGSCGAIYSRFGIVSMHEGAYVIGNSGPGPGGIAAIQQNGLGSFTMDGGVFAHNTSNGNAGAISNGAPTRITGGKFYGNVSLHSNGCAGAIECGLGMNGYGVPNFYLGGDVEIYNNYAKGFGGGVYLGNSGCMAMGGKVKIYDNFAGHGGDTKVADNFYLKTTNNPYYNDGTMIILNTPFEEGTNIGVTMDIGAGAIVQGWASSMGEQSPLDYFFSDNDNCLMRTNSNGDPELFDLSSYAAAIISGNQVDYFTSFANGYAAWVDGSTLRLYADVTAQINVSSGTKTLDLNNHSIRYTSGTVVNVSGGTLNLVDHSANKTTHYYNINTTGVASLSASETPYSFEGGYITGGVASGQRGGGLRVTDTGICNFAGGTFFANKGGWGGAAYTLGNAVLNISGTAAMIGNYSSGDYTSGGAIFCEGNSSINMTGGSIRHNSAQWAGGGVRVCISKDSGKYFTMTGGEITGNYSGSNYGNGIVMDQAKVVRIGGSAKVYGNQRDDNFLVRDGDILQVVEPFTEEASIYIKMATTTGVFTTGWNDIMGTADPKSVFHSENVNYAVRRQNGEAAIGNLHEHAWVYSAENNVITANCSEEGCDLQAQTLTIHAEDKVYDGQPVTATFEYSDGWTADNGLFMPTSNDIVYTNNTEIGEYTASITIGGATASTNFSILHGHEWSYSVNGNIITATCVGHGECDLQTETLTILAEDKVYDGEPVVARLEKSDGWSSENGLTVPSDNDIVYSGNTNSGTYTASISIGDVVASISFTIEIKKEEEVEVSTDLPGVVIDGLEAESQSLAEQNPTANEVKVTMDVESKTEENAMHAEEIREEAGYARLQFFSAVVTKTVDGQTSTMDETSNILEIAMPYAYANKRDIVVYSYHDDAIVTFIRNDTREHGTFRVDAENNMVYIYTNRFSTFAISYTPYYNINVNVNLGSYEGTANVTLENIDGSATFVQENVAMGNVKFENVAIGIYRLTISWVDGHSNSITRLISVGGVAIPTNL